MSDPLDDPERRVRWYALIEVEEGEHDRLRVAPASHGTLSWAAGIVRALYPANAGNEPSAGVLQHPDQHPPGKPSTDVGSVLASPQDQLCHGQYS